MKITDLCGLTLEVTINKLLHAKALEPEVTCEELKEGIKNLLMEAEGTLEVGLRFVRYNATTKGLEDRTVIFVRNTQKSNTRDWDEEVDDLFQRSIFEYMDSLPRARKENITVELSYPIDSQAELDRLLFALMTKRGELLDSDLEVFQDSVAITLIRHFNSKMIEYVYKVWDRVKHETRYLTIQVKKHGST